MAQWRSVLFGLCLLAPGARAEEWKASFNADVEAEALAWGDHRVGVDDHQFRGLLGVKAPASLRYGRALRFKARPLLQLDPANPSPGERVYADAQEAYVQYTSRPWSFQLGLNTFTWGDTDIFNPLDVLNARRYFDPLRSEKIGAPALSVKRDFENFFVEGVYIPWQRRTRLPGVNSRWLPRDVVRLRSYETGGTPVRLILPDELNFSYLDSQEARHALSNNLALRAKFRFPGFDWTVAFFHGAALTPDVRPQDVETDLGGISTAGGVTTIRVRAGVPVQLEPTYYPVNLLGTSFTWEVGSFLVKGAAAYTHTIYTPPAYPKRLWENVLALERSFPLGAGTLTAVLQASLVDRGDGLDTTSVSLARMFERSLMAALRWAPSDSVTVLLSGLHDARFGGWLSHSEISYKIADGWRTKLAADVITGPPETPLGTYRRNDRLVAGVGASF